MTEMRAFDVNEHLRRPNTLIRGMPNISESPKEDDIDDESESDEETCYVPEKICDTRRLILRLDFMGIMYIQTEKLANYA